MPDFNYNIPYPGYGQLRYNPQMMMANFAASFGPMQTQAPQLDFNQQQQGSPDVASSILQNGQMQTQAPDLNSGKKTTPPQYQFKSKTTFGQPNFQWIQTSNELKGLGAFAASAQQNRDFRSYNMAQQNPLSQLPVNPNTSKQALYGDPSYDTGGPIGPTSPGGTAVGGRLDERMRTSISDYINYSIVNGGNPLGSTNGRQLLRDASDQFGTDKARDLISSIYLYNQNNANAKGSPEDRIRAFYNTQSNNPNVTQIKDQFRNYGVSPESMYRTSNDTTIEKQQRDVAKQNKGGELPKRAVGGFEEMDEDDLLDLRDDLDKYNEEKGKVAEVAPVEEKEETKSPELSAEEEKEDEARPGRIWRDEVMREEGSEEEDEKEPAEGEGKSEFDSNAPIVPSSGLGPTINSPQGAVENNSLQAFKKGIASSENASYTEGNTHSSAFGKYQFTKGTLENVREKYFPNIDKDNFQYTYRQDPQFQEKVMDAYGSHLLSAFNGNVHEAAVAHFLGEAGARAHWNQSDYQPTANNATVGQYLSRFDKGYNQRAGGHIMNRPQSMDLNLKEPAMKLDFKEGGEYELTDIQAAQLQKFGYQIEKI